MRRCEIMRAASGATGDPIRKREDGYVSAPTVSRRFGGRTDDGQYTKDISENHENVKCF